MQKKMLFLSAFGALAFTEARAVAAPNMTPMYKIYKKLLRAPTPHLPNAPFPFGPSDIRRAYGVDLLANKGAGQTIAIVDAFDNPDAESDLATFNQMFGTPACTTANGCFTKIYATGVAPPVDSGWAFEISLDTQWAHAIAPQAKIMLVEAASNSTTDLFLAVDVAVQNGANIVSMSFSGGEFALERLEDLHFVAPGVTFFASTGDSGNFSGTGYPAASPFVVAVGGTTLVLIPNGSGNYWYEIAWSDSGGGFSQFEPEPPYQTSVQNIGRRGLPDVSFDGDPATGVAVFNNINGGWFQVGGTSVGAPCWAGLHAIVNSIRAANGKGTLKTPQYGMYAAPQLFHDIKIGTNGECGILCDAYPGYDFVTGLGSPIANTLLPFLAGL